MQDNPKNFNDSDAFLDKRTKRYKEYIEWKNQKELQEAIEDGNERNEAIENGNFDEWKANFDNDSKGAGDIIEKVAKATGIDKAVKAVFGDDCGCEERKQRLNQLIRWKPVRCFTEDQYNKWTEFRNRERKNEVTYEQQLFVIELCKALFARAVKPCSSCGKTMKGYIDNINKFYETYQ